MEHNKIIQYTEKIDPLYSRRLSTGLRILIPKTLRSLQKLKEYTIERRRIQPEPSYSVCRECSMDRVQPNGWTEIEDDLWLVGVCCPDCEYRASYFLDQNELNTFQDKLDDGIRSVFHDMNTLHEINENYEIDRFTKMIQSGEIQPDDFLP